ncbi:TlpA family protein disulfide reductase [Chloroflexota bacterium]
MWPAKNQVRITVLAAILAMVLLASTIAVSCSAGQNATRGSEIGSVPPDFQLDNLDGQAVSLSDFRGKPVLVNFWTSWCLPCRSEMPLIQDTFTDKKWVDEGLVVLAIDIGESPSTVREFVENYGLAFPVLLDITRDVSLEYYVRAIPATFFIDRKGIIRDIRIGPFSGMTEIERSLGKIIR